MRLVTQYIGGSGGYLGNFTYATHEEFYPVFCDLEINASDLPGTTRQRFIRILREAEPRVQARIIRGILKKYPPESQPQRTKELHDYFALLADRLDGAVVSLPAPPTITSVVERALADAETLLREQGPTSAVDRVHTALHGYLLAACQRLGIELADDATNTKLLKLLRKHHPALQTLGPRSQDITTILNSCAAILDALNPIRNQASVAHPNEELLKDEEAMLVINVGRSLLHYLDRRLAAP